MSLYYSDTKRKQFEFGFLATLKIMNQVNFFASKQKIALVRPMEDFFEIDSRATKGKSGKWGKKGKLYRMER